MIRTWVCAAAGFLVAAALSACGTGSGHSCGMCGPTLVAVGHDAVWAAQGRSVSRLDPASGRLLGRTQVLPERRSNDIQAIALNGDTAVVGWSGAVATVLPSDRVASRQSRRPPGLVRGMVTVDGQTWMVAGRRAIALAPDGSILMRPRLPARATGLAAGDGLVWAVGGRMKQVRIPHRGFVAIPAGRGFAIAIDAVTGRRVRELTTAPGPTGVAVSGDRIWVASPVGLDQLDAGTGRPLRHARAGAVMIAAGEGHLWSLGYGGVLVRRDAASGMPDGATTSLNQYVGSLTVGAGAVWVGGGVQDTDLFRIDPQEVRVTWRASIPPT